MSGHTHVHLVMAEWGASAVGRCRVPRWRRRGVRDSGELRPNGGACGRGGLLSWIVMPHGQSNLGSLLEGPSCLTGFPMRGRWLMPRSSFVLPRTLGRGKALCRVGTYKMARHCCWMSHRHTAPPSHLLLWRALWQMLWSCAPLINARYCGASLAAMSVCSHCVPAGQHSALGSRPGTLLWWGRGRDSIHLLRSSLPNASALQAS